MKRGRPSDLVLFVDPGFWEHPKVASLTAVERDAWLRILAEQLRSRNGDTLPLGAWGLTRKRIQRYLEAGLLDEKNGSLVVHGWDSWNGREAYKRFLTRERVRRLRARRISDL
jgi:hypothetical protein